MKTSWNRIHEEQPTRFVVRRMRVEPAGMPVPSTGTSQTSGLPSPSRNREGLGAGSSDQPGRASSAARLSPSRQPRRRASQPRSSNALPASFIKHAAQVLNEQRAFRVHLLNQVDGAPEATSDAGRWFLRPPHREEPALIELDQLSRLDVASGATSDAVRDEIDATLREAEQAALAVGLGEPRAAVVRPGPRTRRTTCVTPLTHTTPEPDLSGRQR